MGRSALLVPRCAGHNVRKRSFLEEDAMTPTKAGGTVKKAAAGKSAAGKSAAGRSAAGRSAAKKTTATKSTAKKAPPRKTAASGAQQGPVRRDLSSLVNDMRTALDELALKGDLATMEGRDRLHRQVNEIENRWLRLKQELGLAKSDADSTLETLRSAVAKAEDAMRHMFDAALEGLRKP
jgi:hypothetical protein